MTIPISTTPGNPISWTDWSVQNLPPWCGNDEGPFSVFVGLALVMTADWLSQANEQASLARYVDQPLSPDDVLPYLGVESSLPQYFGETNLAYRDRLQNRWDAWQNGCNATSVPEELTYALGFYPNFVSAVLNFNIGPGGNYSDGSNIPPYPPSLRWWSQFLVSIVLSGPIGSGAEGRSVLVNDQQLATIRYIIGLKKPVDWAPREIIIALGPFTNIWDAGLLWDDGNKWDQPSTGIVERFHC